MSLADNKKKHSSLFILFFCVVFIFGNFTFAKITFADDDDDEEFFSAPQIKKEVKLSDYDPWEGFNRKIFSFNLIVYDNFLVPFSNWYNDNIPLAIRFTFKNVMQNYVVNTNDIILSVLDFDLEAIVVSFWRWTINSIFGVFGGDDVAYDAGLMSYNKSIGDVLYFYHIPRGPYLMLPLLGPSNLRDGLGLTLFTITTSSFCWSYIFQAKKYPHLLSYLNVSSFWHFPFSTKDDLIWISFFHSVGYYMHIASTKGKVINFLSTSAIDRYVSFRTAYFQTLDKEEKNYMDARMNGKTTRKNVCDYDAMIEVPDECNEDPKIYKTTYL